MSDDTLFSIEKTPYNEAMAVRQQQRDVGLTVVSTFSGAGGSSLGMKQAGWRVPYACEFIDSAADTYRANFSTTFVDTRDIREIEASDILDHLHIDQGELDMFEGSPPCSSFSSANVSKTARFGNAKVKSYSDGVHQSTDDLFDEWLRLVDGLRPKAVLAENVPGMLRDDAIDYLRHITSTLDALGYRLHVDVYKVTHYGSATARQRLIFQGIRRDIGVAPTPPRAVSERYTLRDALDTLPIKSPDDEMTHARNLAPSYLREWNKLEPGEGSDVIFQITRTRWDAPLPTITVGGSKNAADPLHPDEPRKFTATEVKWVTGFPADFVLTGKPAQRYERVARAVPPPLYYAHASHMAALLREAGQ
jgi:DNA (cytosine-5)-methyltransferase 1